MSNETNYYELVVNKKKVKVPRVSNIISWAEPKDGLIAWQKRVGTEESEKIKNNAATIGTHVHNALHNVNKHPEKANEIKAKLSSEEMIYFNHHCKFTSMVNTQSSEQRIFFQLPGTSKCYAGTYDREGFLNGEMLVSKEGKQIILSENRAVIDFKNKKKQTAEHYLFRHGLQLAAYALGFNYTNPGKVPVNTALLAIASPRQVNMYYYDPELLDFYKVEFLNILTAYYSFRKFDWNSFTAKAGIVWLDNRPYKQKVNKVPVRVYFKD